jgi:hypothetical protein
MTVTENLREDLKKIIGGTVESAFELKGSSGLFMTIKTEDKPMALVVEEKDNGYGENQRSTEVYVIESLI